MQRPYQGAGPGGSAGGPGRMPGGIDPNMFNQGGAAGGSPGGHSGPRAEKVTKFRFN